MPSLLTLAACFLGTVVLSALATRLALPGLRRLTASQHIREDVPETHLGKAGTPSMGGIPMLAAILTAGVVGSLAAGAFSVRVLLCAGLALGFALVGLVDDWQKLGDTKSKGVLARYRIGAEAILSVLFVTAIALTDPGDAAQTTWIGSTAWPVAPMGLLGLFVIIGTANAVNLTDGLDGLASGLTAIGGIALAIVCGALGLADMTVWAVAIAGGAAGFLLLNAKPAQIWMGDVGSLGIGAALASVAVTGHVEIIFAIVALVFVAEALSVILQVISFQTTGRRIFRMAPLHHHFELAGLDETQVVSRFWLAGLAAAALSLALLCYALP